MAYIPPVNVPFRIRKPDLIPQIKKEVEEDAHYAGCAAGDDM
jgi:hypothetical protein